MWSAEGPSFESVTNQRIIPAQPHPRRQRRRALAGIGLARRAGIDIDEAVRRRARPVRPPHGVAALAGPADRLAAGVEAPGIFALGDVDVDVVEAAGGAVAGGEEEGGERGDDQAG